MPRRIVEKHRLLRARPGETAHVPVGAVFQRHAVLERAVVEGLRRKLGETWEILQGEGEILFVAGLVI